jgi:aryl-alcohol dehydrogenase-like predicted oxidoreductase
LNLAVDACLTRLGVEQIDLLQLHWPDRATNFFTQRGFKPARAESPFNIEATLSALAKLIEAGKVRTIGVANETAWGVAQFLSWAKPAGSPRIVAMQSPYHLLNRSFEIGLAEFAWRESLGVLAYAPLAGGVLTGKYQTSTPEGRLHRHSQHYRHYLRANVQNAAARYVALAAELGWSPAHLALAFVASKAWVSSVIIGATSVAQLEHNLAASALKLPRDVARAIDAIHEEIPNPCP